MLSQSRLAVELSKLKAFSNPDVALEQYATDSQVAAKLLWLAYMQGDIEGKAVADLGCGTGILGIGCLLLGAQKVFFVDTDPQALEVVRANLASLAHYELGKADLVHSTLSSLSKQQLQADTVVQNPPFGTQPGHRHADRSFLLKAFEVAPVVYSIHKATSRSFLEALARDNKFSLTHIVPAQFPIKAQQHFHTRRIHRIDVLCVRFERSS